MAKNYTLDYSASIIEHLGILLYSQVPQALSELITNCWDADAKKVEIFIDYSKNIIEITDDGIGMNQDELNSDFLRVALNRRIENKTDLSPSGRKVTGKKGLGKLALFGIANTIKVVSVQNNLKNSFEMNYEDIKNENDRYHPKSIDDNMPSKKDHGTSIILSDLSLIHIMSIDNLKISLAKRFDKYSSEFKVYLRSNKDNNPKILDENSFKEAIIPSKKQFSYKFPDDFLSEIQDPDEKYGYLRILNEKKINGVVYSNETPLNANKRGISIITRGKLSSEQSDTQFNDRSNDLFNSYIVGFFNIDCIDDDNNKDNISTDRQKIRWESNEEISTLRKYMNSLMNLIQSKWRKDRQKKKIPHSSKVKRINGSKKFNDDDKNKISDFEDVIHNSGVNKEYSKKLLSGFVKNTNSYKFNKNVYDELVPSNFKVPKSVNPKIRRMREEALRILTSGDSEKVIISEGLLLRAILDSTMSSLIIKNINYVNNYLKQNYKDIKYYKDINNDKDVYNLSLTKKFKIFVYFLDSKGSLSKSKGTNILIDDFISRLKIKDRLDELTHDDNKWIDFSTLKNFWDLLSPLFLKSFEFM